MRKLFKIKKKRYGDVYRSCCQQPVEYVSKPENVAYSPVCTKDHI